MTIASFTDAFKSIKTVNGGRFALSANIGDYFSKASSNMYMWDNKIKGGGVSRRLVGGVVSLE